MSRFSEELRALREQAGLTILEVSQQSGVSPTTVARLESGDETNPKIQTVRAIVRACGGKLYVKVRGIR